MFDDAKLYVSDLWLNVKLFLSHACHMHGHALQLFFDGRLPKAKKFFSLACNQDAKSYVRRKKIHRHKSVNIKVNLQSLVQLQV